MKFQNVHIGHDEEAALADKEKLLPMIEGDLKEDAGESFLQITKYYINAPTELAKMSVPSFAYALQNNLDFVGLSNLDAGVYQVTTQLKVVSTALFMMLFLGRKFSTRRWMAICLLMFGVAFVQMNNTPSTEVKTESQENYVVGLSAVLATCVTAGFAGVYFEKMLKDGGSTPFWIRNMQMYSCGVQKLLKFNKFLVHNPPILDSRYSKHVL
uniref:UDP-galactose transporter n=1 Tax=Caenorhabditis tropicalis TaxID=1561998 RepID=A0A1I7UJD0_9PELO